jgi:hypothetical protein
LLGAEVLVDIVRRENTVLSVRTQRDLMTSLIQAGKDEYSYEFFEVSKQLQHLLRIISDTHYVANITASRKGGEGSR